MEQFLQISDFLEYIGPKCIGPAHEDLLKFKDTTPTFPFICSKAYADKIIQAQDPAPLLYQILPQLIENQDVPGFVDDPVGDLPAVEKAAPSLPFVLQKYTGRALVMTTSTCGLHCRFCFRRNYPYTPIPNIHTLLKDWLQDHSDIWEIILSGGDPLMLSQTKFEEVVKVIEECKSVSTLRIHTRLPIVRPDLIEKHLPTLSLIPQHLKAVMVIHANHPDELDQSSKKFFEQLRNQGWTLLNQSTLLHKVNDTPQTLAHLCRKLFDQGVLPYYLHQLDHAKGVAHFEVSDKLANQLIEEIRKVLPGYLVPKLVREIAGEPSKTPL